MVGLVAAAAQGLEVAKLLESQRAVVQVMALKLAGLDAAALAQPAAAV